MVYKEINNNKEKWIVLIHCVCGNEKIFQKQLADLSKLYNIAILRLAGHQLESDIKEATIDSAIEEIHEFALKKNTKVDVFGISLGSMIASKYIVKYPNDVRNCYLLGNIFGFSIPLIKLGYMFLVKINKFIPRSIYMYFITKAILPGKCQNMQRKKLYHSSQNMKGDFLYAWMKEMGKYIKNGKNNLEGVLNSKVRVRIIYGAKDYMFFNWTKKRINVCNQNKLYIIENAGHLCNIEKPELVNKIIEEDNNEVISDN